MSDRDEAVAGVPGIRVEPGSLDAADVDIAPNPDFKPDFVDVDPEPELLHAAGPVKAPSPNQILTALRDFGVDIKTYRNWDHVGRAWSGPDGSPGMLGAVVHHTATASATGSKGCPTLEWASHPYPGDPLPACNAIVGRGPGDTYLLSAGSCYHCGDGGPFPGIGVYERGFHGQFRLWGIEIDDPGLKTNSLTDYQIDNTAKMLAALSQLCGWKSDLSTVITHKCWTDGCHGVNPNGPSPCLGRKNDTLDGPWATYKVSNDPAPYNAPWWRKQTADRIAPPKKWDGVVPTIADALVAYNSLNTSAPVKNDASWRVACRLYDLGFKKDVRGKGQQGYPRSDVKAFREAQGWEPGDGKPTDPLWRRLFNKKTA